MSKPGHFTIRGLVGYAGKLRKAIKNNADPGVWQQQTERLVANVTEQLQSQQLTAEQLTAPTRKAYHYLRNIDFGNSGDAEQAETETETETETDKLPQLRFPGMQRQLDDHAAALAVATTESLSAIADNIESYSRRLEHSIQRDDIRPQQLSAQARAARAWFAWLSDPTQLQQYHHAAMRLQHVLTDMAQQASLGKEPFFSVHFRPVAGLYRLSSHHGQHQLRLPTAMMTLPADCLDELAGHALSLSRSRKRLLAAMEQPAYQDIVTELDALGGRVDRSRGRIHDLGSAFNRVNQRFFDGRMELPALHWSGRNSYRKLGHYDPTIDTIVISATLDSHKVPEQALDFVVFHELLHKRHGIDWRSDQARTHTPAFRRDEQRYPNKIEIEALLGQLSAAQRRTRR